MSKMSTEEYNNLVSGEKSDTDITEDRKTKVEADLKDANTAYSLLLGRSRKTLLVHLDECDIEIRTNLSRDSIKSLAFLKMWAEVMSGDKEAAVLDETDGQDALAEFLEFITIDKDLDSAFWLNGDLDVSISQTIIQEYLFAQSKEAERVIKFRKNR